MAEYKYPDYKTKTMPEKTYSPEEVQQIKLAAYKEGYRDGYRDGHKDA